MSKFWFWNIAVWNATLLLHRLHWPRMQGMQAPILQNSTRFFKFLKTQHVLYFLNEGGSRITNMTFTCVMKVIMAMKVMRISPHICIYLHFSEFLCIYLHFSCDSLHISEFLTHLSAFLSFFLHFFVFLCISLDSIAVSLFTIIHYYHFYHY